MLDRGIEYPSTKGNWNKVQDSTSSRSLKGNVLVPNCQCPANVNGGARKVLTVLHYLVGK